MGLCVVVYVRVRAWEKGGLANDQLVTKVFSKSSWIQCLNQDPPNICPLTKQPLNERDLVVLTPENIEEYRSKIVNGT